MRAVRRAMVVVLAIVVIVVAVFVAWDRWWRRAGPAEPGFSCPKVVHADRRLPFSAVGVHRVALIGDSIMDLASCAVAESLATVGIETSRHAVSGSGLLAGMDWLEATRQILHAEHPDAVVAIFVGNYLFGPAHDASGAVIEDDTPAFFRAWQARAVQLSAEVRAAHARMYWVSPPPIDVAPLRHAQRLFDGYRTIPGDHTLPSGQVLTGAHGSEVMTKDTCGHVRVVRTSDRVHLTFDGARVYGQQIAHDLTADLGVLTAPRPC